MKHSLFATAALACAALAGLAPAQNITVRDNIVLTDINTISQITSFSNIVQTEDDVSVVVYNDSNGLQAFYSDGQAIQWNGPVVLDPNTSARPRISTVQIVDQNVVVLYTDGFQNLRCIVSTDGGQTWGTSVAVTTSGTVDETAFALAAGNFGAMGLFGIYVTWVEDDSANRGVLKFSQSLDAGQTFSTPRNIPSNAAADVDRCDIYADVLFVAIAFRSAGDVYLQTSTDTGQTFPNADLLVSSGSGLADGSEIDIFGAAPRLGVFWQENTIAQSGPDPTDIKGRVSTTFGSTFGPEVTIARAIDIDEARFGAFTGPNLVVVYEDFTTSEVTARTSTDQGSSYGTPVQLSTPALGSGNFPNLASSDDTVAVTWNDSSFPNKAIASVSRNNGLAWTTETVVGTLSLNGVTGDIDFTRIEYNDLYDNVVLVSRIDGDFMNGAGTTSDLLAHGFRATHVQEQGWSTRTGPLGFTVEGFGADPAAVVLVSLTAPNSGPLFNDPLNRSTGFVFDTATTSLIFIAAPLTNGNGTTNALPNFLGLIPVIGVDLYYAGFGITAGNQWGRVSDVRSVGI